MEKIYELFKKIMTILADNTTQDERNQLGQAFYFILGVLFNVLSFVVLLFVEYSQKKMNNTEIEYDDIKRYSKAIIIGIIVNIILFKCIL